ncbi:YigZ family protein [Paenibacillus darwinianus]|uniref:IMPACT family protein n=1 Tax=Paenibacillus darwinianus TaxID=1380763 RepID=UPI00044EBC35|nr:YigZ family protein [Paenibacillus darwinianus]EXX89735.1 YigZ family protein [Paenibacillus darwinianus]
MLERYKTLRQEASREIVIRKSRFIGYAKPVADEAEAVAYVEEIKKKPAPNANQIVIFSGFKMRPLFKQSDDGEPSGTAGKPILEVIKAQGLKNTVVVVTRYFGGIMLGAGGLIRAYTDGAVAGIDAAVPIVNVLHREVLVDVDYTWYGKIENELRGRGVRTGEVSFTDRVTVTCLPEAPEAERFVNWMTDLIQGQGNITLGESRYYVESE